MGIYAQRPAKLASQLVADVFVILWGVLWWLVGSLVHQTISIIATPAREVARTSSKLAGDFRDAATEAAKVPGVGDQLQPARSTA
jgi:hypothetical protein